MGGCLALCLGKKWKKNLANRVLGEEEDAAYLKIDDFLQANSEDKKKIEKINIGN